MLYFSIIQTPKINNQITALELMIVDDEGANLGKMSRDEAFKLAQEKGLDLIEVSPGAKPPVARIMSFDKYRYQQEKKFKKQKVSQKSQELKHVQITIRAAKNDLEVKARKLNEFLAEGHPVEIIMVLRGREKYNRDFAMEKMKKFFDMISPDKKIVVEPKFSMRGISMIVIKA